MLTVASTSPMHHIGILMSPKGRFLHCINCGLTLEFLPEANYDEIVKGFESHSCSTPPPPSLSKKLAII